MSAATTGPAVTAGAMLPRPPTPHVPGGSESPGPAREIHIPAWLTAAPGMLAAAAGALAVAAGTLGYARGQAQGPLALPPAAALALGSLAVAVAAAARGGRRARLAAALAALLGFGLLGLALAHPHARPPAPPITALCVALVATGLGVKPRWRGLAAGLDLFVVFVTFTTGLSRALGVAGNARPGAAMNLGSALALLALALGSMAAWPRLRPGAYCFEPTSAGRMLRRLLGLTLAFPAALLAVQFAGRHGGPVLRSLGSLLLLAGFVVFWTALLWLISRSLDQLDEAHRTAEADLRASEERYRLLLEATSEGIYALNLDGTCRWCNPAAAELLGYGSPDELLGRKIHALIHHTRPDGTPYPAEECVMAVAAQEGRSAQGDDELVWRADGTSFRVEYRSDLVWRGGKLDAIVVTFNDVTRKRRFEEQLRQSQKMEAVGRLAAGIAHDFNNLLTVIIGYSEMLLAQELPPRTRDKVADVHKAGEKAAALTHQLLAYSRQQVLQPKLMDLNAVLRDMDKLLRRVIGEDVHLETTLAPELAPVEADPGQIEQVLMNLAINARDAMAKGGRLTIETANVELDAAYVATHPQAQPGEYCMLAVTDTGEGMSPEVQAHIFEPFYTTKAKGKGTGLGLATVFGIVKQSGGTMDVYSEPDVGTSFKVYLPSRAGKVTDRHAAAAALKPAGGRGTILVVEDEEQLGRYVNSVLNDAGYEVLLTSTPELALATSRSHAGVIDLLVTDVILPGMNGRELSQRLQGQRPEMRVLFVSGYPDRAIIHNGTLEPSLWFLQKPFTAAGLLEKIRAVLEGPAGMHALPE